MNTLQTIQCYLALAPKLAETLSGNICVRHPELLPRMFGRELRANALKKYKRDNATCDKEQFIALYISACIYELKKRPHKYLIPVKR